MVDLAMRSIKGKFGVSIYARRNVGWFVSPTSRESVDIPPSEAMKVSVWLWIGTFSGIVA